MNWFKEQAEWVWEKSGMKWLYDALHDIYDKLVATLYSWAVDLWELGVWMVDSVCWFFWEMIDFAIWFFWEVVYFCLGMAWDACYYFYALFLGENGFLWYPIYWGIWACWQFLDFFPSTRELVLQYQGTFSYVGQLTGKFNSFFPVVESFQLGLAFAVFVTAFLLGKLIMKLVPTIG